MSDRRLEGRQQVNGSSSAAEQAARLSEEWAASPRWRSVKRTYSAHDVIRLRGTVREEHTLARLGAERLWRLLHERDYVHSLGALSGNQAVQQVRAGLPAIYLSGWQVAADANLAGETYPDQSLYPANSVPQVVRRINNALLRADQISWAEAGDGAAGDQPHWLAPIVADAEAGFGGALNAFELMKGMIEAGAAGVHFEDQLASEKKCGHMGGKVLVPPSQFVKTLNAARLAADVLGVPTLVVARTDARAATLITSDVDERDRPFLTGERTAEGFYRVRNGMPAGIARGLAYAPYSDLLWMETSTPDLDEAREFAEAIKDVYPDQMLSTPSFRARCLPTTARRRSTGKRTWMIRPSPSSSASSARWATSSSSSRWPDSTRSTTRCSTWPAATRPRACRPTSGCRTPSSPPSRPAIPPPATSARSGPGTSTW